MTLHEYSVRMKAVELQRLDKQYDIHLQAWVSQQAKAVKKNGKPVYRTFDKFFDYKKEEQKILGTIEKDAEEESPLIELIGMANQGGKEVVRGEL